MVKARPFYILFLIKLQVERSNVILSFYSEFLCPEKIINLNYVTIKSLGKVTKSRACCNEAG